jgi:hypothetical protein
MTDFHLQSSSQNQKRPTDPRPKQLSERASTVEEVLHMVTKATKISNHERTRTKIPSMGTLPLAENRSGRADQEEEKKDQT